MLKFTLEIPLIMLLGGVVSLEFIIFLTWLLKMIKYPIFERDRESRWGFR
jgi:hypothetical protein